MEIDSVRSMSIPKKGSGRFCAPGFRPTHTGGCLSISLIFYKSDCLVCVHQLFTYTG